MERQVDSSSFISEPKASTKQRQLTLNPGIASTVCRSLSHCSSFLLNPLHLLFSLPLLHCSWKFQLKICLAMADELFLDACPVIIWKSVPQIFPL